MQLSRAGVSFQIKQVESVTGLPLFERVGKRLALTSANQELVVYTNIVLRALDDADQALMVLRDAGRSSIEIGIVSAARYIVPHMLTRGLIERGGKVRRPEEVLKMTLGI